MRECDLCGFPRKFARFFEWRGDGTIVSSDPAAPLQRAFLEAGELEELLAALSSSIGISVDRFLIEAQKNVGKALFEIMPMKRLGRIPNRRYLRPEFAARLMMRPVSEKIAELGNGRPVIDRYRAGDSWILRFRNPCVPPILIGSSLGIFESMEGCRTSAYEYRLEGGDLVIRIRHGGTTPDSEKRLYLEEVRPGAGPFLYDSCPECGAPLPASMAFAWDLEKGIISNRLTGKREVVVAVQALNAMLRELESELGEEIPGILYETQKELERGRLSALSLTEPGLFWTGHLAGLAMHGLGYPLKFEEGERSISVETGNTYNQILYAAKLAAGLERVTGLVTGIEWSSRERSNAAYTITA